MASSSSSIRESLWDVSHRVAAEYARLPVVAGVVAGGSLARGFSDERSDIELYVYFHGTIPSRRSIEHLLAGLHAVKTRSENVHWHHPAWGTHTFFSVDGIKVELGYRELDEIDGRMRRFRRALILPTHGIYDTPFGHYESGVANCIRSCVILRDRRGEIRQLKRLVATYPKRLQRETIDYYLHDAQTLCAVKLQQAVDRGDTYLFNACVARIVRSIVITVFTLNGEYYPGDKWNQRYLDAFLVKPPRFQETIDTIFRTPQDGRRNQTRIAELLGLLTTALSRA